MPAGLGGAGAGQLLPAVSREVLRAGPDAAAVRAAESGRATRLRIWPDRLAATRATRRRVVKNAETTAAGFQISTPVRP